MATCWIVLLLVIVDKLAIFETCRSGIECPSHKPFCSSLGCLHKCPEPFYKNNTDCVINCGDWFVESGQTCVKECRPMEFIEETLKISSVLFIERKCVSECPKFIFNTTCTDICPVDYDILYDESYTTSRNGDLYSILRNKRCVEKCPDSFRFKQTISSLGESITICTAECSMYSENGYCVDVCSGQSVIFNKTCVSTCPESHPVLNKYRVCLKLCRHGNVEESSCACPWNKPFLQNKTCVDECGPTMFQWNHNETNLCIDSCFKDEFIYNATCVKDCPSKTYKLRDKCLYECPESMPYYCAFNSAGICDDRSLIFTCFEKCPVGMYVEEFNCKYSCSNYTINLTCLNKCPETLPLSFYNETIINCIYGRWCINIIRQINCLAECPNGYYRQQNACVKACEKNEYIFNETCLTQCPHQMKSRNFTIQYTEIKDKGPTYYERYVHETKSQLTNKCVNNCVTNEYQYNNTCVAACPDDKRYVTNQVCDVGPCIKGFYYNMTTFNRCVDVCNESDFILNSECIYVCPNNTYALNNHCVNECPNYTLLTRKVKTGCKTNCPNVFVHVYTRCLEQCPNNTYKLNNSCVEFCPKQYVTADRDCLQSCPEMIPYKNETTLRAFTWTYSNNRWTYDGYDFLEKRCLANCPDGYFKRSDTCKIACEKNEYIFNDTCLTECPSHTKYRNYTIQFTEPKDRGPFYYYNRYINETKLQFIYKCVNSCKSNEYQYNKTCVTTCHDDSPYSSNGVCSFDPYTTNFYYNMTTFFLCVDTCEESDFILDSECVYVCPNNTYAFNSRCVNMCPNDAFLTLNMKTECGTRSNCSDTKFPLYKSCVRNCPREKYTLNKSCVDFCPEQYVTVERNCVRSCPYNLPYTNETCVQIHQWIQNNKRWEYSKQIKRIKNCVSDCINQGRLLDLQESNCVDSCPTSQRYLENNLCKSECSNKLITNEQRNGTECVEKCPNRKLVLNNTCVDICPNETKYQYDGSCLQSCPSESPFGVQKLMLDHFFELTIIYVCINSCEDRKLFLNGECVYSFECEYPMFAFQGQCLFQCSAGSVHTFSGGCLSVKNVTIAILVIIGTLGVICIYTRKIIRDCVWVCLVMFTGDSSSITGLKNVSRDADQFQLEMNNLTFSSCETEQEEKETSF